jgi:hypothetical protein
MGALTAGAIGSGLGSAIETGDIGEGLKSGLLSFVGGKMFGDVLGAKAGTAAGAAGDAATKAITTGATTGAATAAAGAQPGMGGSLGLKGLLNPSQMFTDPTRAMLADPSKLGPGMIGKNMPGMVGSALNKMTSPQMLPYMAGSQLGGLAASIPMSATVGSGKKDKPTPYVRSPAPGMVTNFPGAGYNPGHDGEFNYKVPIYRVQNMAEGGIVNAASDTDKQLIQTAASAIKGEIPEEDAKIVLGKFLIRFGEEALRNLVAQVEQSGPSDGKVVQGPGDGQSDQVPAETDAGGKVALSNGEFVVPSDVVSDLGNGSTDAGAQHLYNMMHRVRSTRRGAPVPPPSIDPQRMMPA